MSHCHTPSEEIDLILKKMKDDGYITNSQFKYRSRNATSEHEIHHDPFPPFSAYFGKAKIVLKAHSQLCEKPGLPPVIPKKEGDGSLRREFKEKTTNRICHKYWRKDIGNTTPYREAYRKSHFPELIEWIKTIQLNEGNFPCFATATAGVCDQCRCCWRDDCLSAS